jgi:hypothetical protein
LKSATKSFAYYVPSATSGSWSTGDLGNKGISNFRVYTTSSQPVPEPLTILGTGAALGFGAMFRRRQANRQQQV